MVPFLVHIENHTVMSVTQNWVTNHINKLNYGGWWNEKSSGNVPDKNHTELHETARMATFDSA